MTDRRDVILNVENSQCTFELLKEKHEIHFGVHRHFHLQFRIGSILL